MNWIKTKLCDWFHGGGRIKRDQQGRINWQCDTCGRWGTPVEKEDEDRMIDRHISEATARRSKQKRMEGI